MRRSRRFSLGLALGCFALAWALVLGAGRGTGEDRRSLPERLVGPFAGLLASVQWVRADLALREGRLGTFCERAETALALAPADPQAWIYYANTLIWARAAPDRERRESWVRAGLEVLGRAERECANPAEIWAYEGGVFFALSLMSAEERPWPGEPRELLEHAIEAFARARALGHPQAAVLEQALRERLAELKR
jgi:hypothetical protein